MQFYKKVFLTFMGAGTLSSCALQKNVTIPATATVVNITDNFYLDKNGDGTADICMYVRGDTDENEQCYFYDYIQIGDTLKYRTSNKRLVNLNANGACPNVFLDSVNNRSVDDLVRLYKLKYKTFGQSKVK